MTPQIAQLEALVPIGLVAFAAILLVMADALFMKGEDEAREREVGSWKGSLLAAIAGVFLFFTMTSAASNFAMGKPAISTAGGMLVVDSLSNFAMALLGFGALVTLWFAVSHLPRARIHHGEFYALLMFAVAGALGLVCAANFISLFVAIELMSLPFYVLAAFDRDRSQSVESGMRLLLTGGFASALSLYGIALIYGATGRLDYLSIQTVAGADVPLALAGMGLLLVGLLTRLAAAPFHYWLPNVSEGAPTVIAGCMATLLVGASAFALLRLFGVSFSADFDAFRQALSLLAGLSVLVGSVMALVQTDLKRILAYGGVAHSGFFLAAIVAQQAEGSRAALFVVSTFVFMQLGAFGALSVMSARGRDAVRPQEFAGLAKRRPILAAAMSLFLLGLAGLPGTAGFVSRLQVMSVTIGAEDVLLTLSIGLASVVLFAAYLRIPTAMYMGQGAGGRAQPTPLPALIALLVCAFATVYLGIYPGEGPLSFEMLDFVRRATAR